MGVVGYCGFLLGIVGFLLGIVGYLLGIVGYSWVLWVIVGFCRVL